MEETTPREIEPALSEPHPLSTFPDGIKVLHGSPDASIDICFVHGLTGDRERTWTADSQSIPWPKALLSSRFQQARILTYGYDAYVTRKSVASSNRLSDHAINLLTDLTSDRGSCNASSRPLIFVVHSLGGLVCKKAILLSRNNPEVHLRSIFNALKGVIFMGTPHKGAWMADWAKIPASALGFVKSTNFMLLDVLQRDNQLLESIQVDFLAMLGAGIIVSKDSATFEGYAPRSIHSNHRDMVRFASAEETGFKRLLGELARWIAEVDQISSASELREKTDHIFDAGNRACLKDLQTTNPRKDKGRIEKSKGRLPKDSYREILNKGHFTQWRYLQKGHLLCMGGHQQSWRQGRRRIQTAKCYNTMAGRLSVERSQVDTNSAVNWMVENFQITFLPPSWISDTLLRINVDNYHRTFHTQSVPQWSIRPVSINRNPRLIDALWSCNVTELKSLFSANAARPTDMIYDDVQNESITLLETLLRAFTTTTPCSSKLLKHRLMFQFLLGLTPQPLEQAIVTFFLSCNDQWAYDQHQLSQSLVDNNFQSILGKGGCSLESVSIPFRLFLPGGRYSLVYGARDGQIHQSILSTLVEHSLGFEAIHDCLFNSSQVWTTDDLTLRSIWYIGILAYIDHTFRAGLREYISSFRSRISGVATDSTVLAIFDIKRIVEQVKTSPLHDRAIFLKTVIGKGTPEMLEPFLNVGIDLDEGGTRDNYLGLAAAQGKLTVVSSLMDAGACTARALPLLCDAYGLQGSKFDFMFPKFMESTTDMKGRLTPFYLDDPISAVLRNTRALETHTDSVKVLLKRNAFQSLLLHGSQDVSVRNSYILNSILHNRPSALETLLEYGIPLDVRISDMFRTDPEWYQPLGNYTWLTLAVELGRTTCVETLLRSSGNPVYLVRQPDGGGRCANSLARALTASSHPRISTLKRSHWINDLLEDAVSASEDTATYNILRTVLGADHEELSTIPSNPAESPMDVPSTGLRDSESGQDKLSLDKIFRVSLWYIGMYGMLMSYIVLQFAISLAARRRILRTGMFWAAVIPLISIFLYDSKHL